MKIQPNPHGYFRNLITSTRHGVEKGYADTYEAQTLRTYDHMKGQPRFQKDNCPLTVGEFCQAYPAYRYSATAAGIAGAVVGGIVGFALGVAGRSI